MKSPEFYAIGCDAKNCEQEFSYEQFARGDKAPRSWRLIRHAAPGNVTAFCPKHNKRPGRRRKGVGL